jgi:hypothetical protein
VIRYAVVAALLVALCACDVQNNESSSPSRNDGRYSSVKHLKDAAVKAGYRCASWKETQIGLSGHGVGWSTESGTCGGDVFTIFTDNDRSLHQYRAPA